MTNPTDPQKPDIADAPIDEGGLRAPAHLSRWQKAWWWFDFLILVKLARLRFIAILAAIGIVITQWDTLVAYYDKWTRPKGTAASQSSNVEYFCPMHPTVIRDNGKEKCPICFMPLAKRKKGEKSEEVLPAGVVNRVQLTPYRVVLAGIKTWLVDEIPLTKEIQATGYIEFNERGLKNVSARVKGRLDELSINETGRLVHSGDLLASLYSPDLNVTVQNLLDAKRRGSTDLLASARQRLELLGVGNDQVDDILQSGKANSHIRIRSPISGHVIKKYVREGQYVEEGSPLFDVADLSTVWIQAQIYEDEMAFLPLEQSHRLTESLPVVATTRAFPGEEFRGQLTFVYPHVDQQSRTVTVRFELDNPGHKLRPGMTATTILLIPPSRVPILKPLGQSEERARSLQSGRVLAIPESSVIDTGSQTVVYREALPGTYEGVLVTLGPKMTGPNNVAFYPVVSGLEQGDLIATSGSFLIDAETRLNPAAGSIYFGGSGGSKTTASSVTTVRPTTPENEDAKLTAALKKLKPDDRAIAEKQVFCPILQDSRLGSMGIPVKLTLQGKTVFVCCPACEKPATDDAEGTLKKIEAHESSANHKSGKVAEKQRPSDTEQKIHANLAKLSEEDRRLALEQRECVVLPNSRLGSMGVPRKLIIEGQPVFICCPGCEKAALANPKSALKRLEELKATNRSNAPPSVEPQSGSGKSTDDEAILLQLEPDVRTELAKLSPPERKRVLAQRFCPIARDSQLGSMGPPLKIVIDGQEVFLCCEGCEDTARKESKDTVLKVKQLIKEHEADRGGRAP